MSNEFYTAADFITEVESLGDRKIITHMERKTLLRDMANILEKASENGPIKHLEINTFTLDANSRLEVKTNTYNINYRENGIVNSEFWYSENDHHRGGGKPAAIRYYPNGIPRIKHWFRNGVGYREDNKPIIEFYDEKGNVRDPNLNSNNSTAPQWTPQWI